MRLEKLGTDNPLCGTCGETDDRCFEAHHIAGRRHDDLTVNICCNCHRKVSDDQRDHPPFVAGADPMLAAIGHFLLGFADLLRIVFERLYEYGRLLIDRAAVEGGAV